MTHKSTLIPRLGLALAAAALATAAPASAMPQWLAPQAVSEPGQDAKKQQVAFDRGGDAVAVWQNNAAPSVVLAAARPAGGSFTAPQTLSDPSRESTIPDVAIDAHGNAVAVWLHSDGANKRVQAAYRPAGGSFGTPQTISRASFDAAEPRVALDESGDAVLVWSLGSGAKAKIQAAVAPPGGSFGGPVDLTAFTAGESAPQVALDAHGNAIAVWDGTDGANVGIQASEMPAGGSFGAPHFLSPAGTKAGDPQVAFDSSGDALAVWHYDVPPSIIQAAYRPAGGVFGAPVTVSAPSAKPAQEPQVGFDGLGSAVVVWKQSDGTDERVLASVRSPGIAGTFGAQSILDLGGQNATKPRVAGDGLSGTIVSWKTENGKTTSTQAAVRTAGGSFGPVVTIAAQSAQNDAPEVGIDEGGNGIAVWSASNGASMLLEAAGYDAGPLLRGLLLPSQGTVGQPLQFFQAPIGIWNPVLSEGFSFGDGASASGFAATHGYGAAGSYPVSAIATDVLGNATTVTRTVVISAPAPLAAAAPLAEAVPFHCVLAKPHHGRLLHGRRLSVSLTCSRSLSAAVSGRLTVSVPRPRRHHRHGSHTSLVSYALKGVHAQLVAGQPYTVTLTLSARTSSVVLAALSGHRAVGLDVTVLGAPGVKAGAHMGITTAPPKPRRHTGGHR